MKDAGKAVFGLVLLGTVLIFLYLPLGRTYIPNIAHFFSEREGVWDNARAASYPTEELLSINTLNDSVRVYRDPNGIPHIFANDQEDALMVLGYLTARDRLFQIMWNARMVAGQLHQWVGDDYIKHDKAMLKLGLNEMSWAQHSSLDDREYGIIQAYQRGINQYLNQYRRGNGALEFSMLDINNRYWRPVDCLRILNLWGIRFALSDHALELKYALDQEGKDRFQKFYDIPIADIYSLVGKDVPAKNVQEYLGQIMSSMKSVTGGSQLEYSAVQMASRNGTHSALGTNLQSSLQLPHTYYPVRISTPEWDVFGFTLPGTPLFITGSGNNASWSLIGKRGTLRFQDVKQNQSKRTNHYKLNREQSKPDTLDVVTTQNGNPIWELESGQRVQMSWDGAETYKLISSMWGMGKANNNQITGHWPGYKITTISNEGNITILDENQSFSPQNNVVSSSSHPGRVVPKEQDLIHWNWQDRQILRSSDQLLASEQEEIFNALLDTKIPQKVIKPYLLKAISGQSDRLYFRLQNAIQEWDFSADRNSSLPVFLEYFMRYTREMIWDELTGDIYPDDRVWIQKMIADPQDPIFDRQSTSKREDIYDLMKQAANEALNTSQIEYGNFESWNWGSLTNTDTRHASGIPSLNLFSSYSVAREGFIGSINELRYRSLSYGTNFHFYSNYSSRLKKPEVKYMWTGGVSENVFNKYHHNGLEAWNNRTYTDFVWATQDQQDFWISKLVMTPAIR